MFLPLLLELEDQYLAFAVNSGNTPEKVYILMNIPETDEEGVRTAEYPKEGSGVAWKFVYGLEELGDCIQFSTALKKKIPTFPSKQPGDMLLGHVWLVKRKRFS